MKCPNCGAEVPDGASFCGRCGEGIGHVGYPPTQARNSEPPYEADASQEKAARRKSVRDVFCNTIFPICALVAGLYAIWDLLGISTYVDYFVFGNLPVIDASTAIGALIPFSITGALCVAAAFVLKHLSEDGAHEKMAKVGLIITIVCFVISCTDAGFAFQGMAYGMVTEIDSIQHPDQSFAATADDYTIEVSNTSEGTGDGMVILANSGTITNTTKYDWKSVKIVLQETATETAFNKSYDGKQVTITCKDVPSGGSAELSSDGDPSSGMVDYGDYTTTVVSVTYTITEKEANSK